MPACQHLIDDFWSLVNRAKKNEQVAALCRKMTKPVGGSITGSLNCDSFGLSEDDKSEVQELIARSNSTNVGMNNNVISPSAMLSSCNFQQDSASVKTECIESKVNTSAKGKSQQQSANTTITNTAGLKYIDGFTNPYVKIILACKVCNKEQTSKSANDWKRHYMTHSDQKPHACQHCPKSFIRADKLRKHIEAQHGGMGNSGGIGNSGSGGGVVGRMQLSMQQFTPKPDPGFPIKQDPGFPMMGGDSL